MVSGSVMSHTRRLFIALPFDEKARASLADTARLIGSFAGRIKGVSPDTYHITVKFLGGVDRDLADRVAREFGALDIGRGKIPYTIQGLGAFPSLSRASVLWAGVIAQGDGLVSLFRFIEDFSAALGFARETRAFRPHLTLGRVKGEGGAPGPLKEHFMSNRDRVFAESAFSRLVLYESELRPEGPLYTEISSKEL